MCGLQLIICGMDRNARARGVYRESEKRVRETIGKAYLSGGKGGSNDDVGV